MAFEFKGQVRALMGSLSPSRAGALGLALAATMTGSAWQAPVHMSVYGAPGTVHAATTGFKLGAARARVAATCFGNQLDDLPNGVDVAHSVVFLFSDSAETKYAFSGSGFVVKDSVNKAGGHNHILTASHVDPPPGAGPGEAIAAGGKRIAMSIFSSEGLYLGKARAVYAGAVAKSLGPVSDASSDIAVLEMTEGGDDGWGSYDKVPGVALSKSQPSSLMTAVFKDRFGMDDGASGGLVLDLSTGTAVGIATSVASSGKEVAIPSDIGRITSEIYNKYPKSMEQFSSKDMPQSILERSRGYMVPANQPEVAENLGNAGKDVKTSSIEDEKNIEVIGFPKDSCVVYKAQASAMDMKNPYHMTEYAGVYDALEKLPEIALQTLVSGVEEIRDKLSASQVTAPAHKSGDPDLVKGFWPSSGMVPRGPKP